MFETAEDYVDLGLKAKNGEMSKISVEILGIEHASNPEFNAYYLEYRKEGGGVLAPSLLLLGHSSPVLKVATY